MRVRLTGLWINTTQKAINLIHPSAAERNDEREIAITDALNPAFDEGILFQPPRYAQLTVTVDL